MSDGILYDSNSIVFDRVIETDGKLDIQGAFERSNSDVWRFIAYEGTKYLNSETVEITIVRGDEETVYRGKFDGGTIEQRRNDIRLNIGFVIERL